MNCSAKYVCAAARMFSFCQKCTGSDSTTAVGTINIYKTRARISQVPMMPRALLLFFFTVCLLTFPSISCVLRSATSMTVGRLHVLLRVE